MKRIIAVIAWSAVALTAALTLPYLLLCCAEWSGDDLDEAIGESFCASVPVIAAILSSLVAYAFLRIWFVRRQEYSIGSMRIAYSVSLLGAIITLWGLPIVWALWKEGPSSYEINWLMLPSFWMNFRSPSFLWPTFLCISILGAFIGYRMSGNTNYLREIKA
jgi:hypothetical protein